MKDLLLQAGAARATSTNTVNTASTPVSTACPSGGLSYTDLTNTNQDDSQIPALEDIYDNPNDDPKSAVQTRSKVNNSSRAHAFVSYIQKQRKNNPKDFQHCLFACFQSQIEPKKISDALEDKSWVNAMQEELLQEERIDYDKVFALVARIEAIRIFLAFASYMGFIVYQMDVKSAFLYGKIDEEVYVSQPLGFVDPKFPKKVYKVVKALYGLHQAPRAWYLNAVKRIFRYLKGKPKLGLWYPRVSSFDLDAYSDSDYARANLDIKPTTGGCQFLGRRLISWQCTKQTIVATSTTEVEYVAAANCCRQVLWIQNQMLDYGFNLMNTKIYIDNESTRCIVKNPVFHSKTKHIEIRHHVIRDAYEKKLIQVLKIHTDDNVADLLTKASDVSRLRATYGAELVSVASLVNTARPTLSAARLVNDEKQIHATVDSKGVLVIEASIRSSLLLIDADAIACLTNEAIFQNLALMRYEGELNKLTFQKALFSPQRKYLIDTILHCLSLKSTSWNVFSTNIASAVICLATNQKFNFSKLIFDSMLRNLDTSKNKFLMYPRFLMVFLNNQIELGKPFNDVYVTPAHTQKVFLNMSRKGVKFLGKVTPLFDSMLVPHQAPEGEGSEQPTEPQPIPSPTQPSKGDQPSKTSSSSSHDINQDSRDSLEGTNRSEEDQVQPSHDSPLSGGPTSDRAEGGITLEELSIICTNLSNGVLIFKI
ncbi:putative ribonuclease H-like domain-containing protein [Tanacetum coccineum]